MFTSTNTINPFTLLSCSSSSSSYNLSSYILDHETGHEIFFDHQNPPTIPPSQIDPQAVDTLHNNATISKQNVSVIDGDQQQSPPVLLPGKKPVKKDRHSKISTAHGLRDRRVRLSIQIARKFFDLQDMLGFDKASKTLDWLLSKSRKAIKELTKNEGAGGGKSLSSSSTTCASEEGIVSEKDDDPSMATANGFRNEKRTKKIRKAANSSAALSNLVAKESRAKARERARERTRVKMYSRKFNESNTDISYHHHQACSGDSLKIVTHHHQNPVEESSNNYNPSSFANLVHKGNLMEESIVIARKLDPATMVGYQQKQQQILAMLKDISWSNDNNLLSLTQNWDINQCNCTL